MGKQAVLDAFSLHPFQPIEVAEMKVVSLKKDLLLDYSKTSE